MRRLDLPARPADDLLLLDPDTAMPEWEALCETTGAAPFHRPGWYLRWADAFAPGRLHVALGREHGEVVAALPLLVGHGSARAPVNGHTPEFGVVARDPGARHRLLCDVIAGSPHGLHIDELDLGQVEADELDWALTSQTRHASFGPSGTTIATDVRGSWDEFLAGLRSDRRREVRLSLDRTRRHGDVDIGVHRGQGAVCDLLDACLAVEAAGWKGREGTAVVSQPATRRFYEQLMAWAAGHGWAELRTLRIAGDLAAMQLALRHDGVLYLLKTGYDERYAAAAPGKALQHEIVRSAFEDPGLDRIEWLGSDGELKRVLGNRSRVLYRLAAFPAGPAGSLAHLASQSTWRGGDWARRHLPASVRARVRSTRNRWQARRSGGELP